MTSFAQTTAIIEAFDAARRVNPRTNAIGIAEQLGISEGELQAARIGRDVWTLPLAPSEMAARFHTLGNVKCLTRSSLAVLEQNGTYPPLGGSQHAGLLLDPGGLDLRLMYSHWYWICLIRDPMPDKNDAPNKGAVPAARWSLQVFNQHGQAVHKVFAKGATAQSQTLPDSWETLRQEGTLDTPAFTQSAQPPTRPLPEAPTLAREWAAMTDVHQFFSLLKRHQLRRLEANTLMQGSFTQALPVHALESLLRQASQQTLPIMLFVASQGCVQIRTGTLPTPLRAGGWLNLFGDCFTLHLDDQAVTSVWVVEKPNRDGGVTSVEAFDKRGDLVLQIYAERQEGRPERSAWRNLLTTLTRQEAVA